MLDRNGGDVGELQHRAQRRVGIQDIIEGQFFTLKLFGLGDGRPGVAFGAVEARSMPGFRRSACPVLPTWL